MAYDPRPEHDTETLVRRVIDVVGNAKSMPLSNSVLISKDEVLELLQDAVDRLPEELKQARWMLRERQEFLAKVEREAEEILDAARARAERMVQRTEIVREAEATANRLVEEARDESSRLRNEAEDYCDQKLASFEIILTKTLQMVETGRQKLSVAPIAAPPSADEPEIDDAFFDQDDSEV